MSQAHRFQKGSARMFENDLLEKLSHVHPLTPLVLFVPVIVLSIGAALFAYGGSAVDLAWQIPVGYFSWTLLEYWLHRELFHLPVIGPISERVYFFVHGVHHDWPWDTSRLVLPPAVSISLGVMFYALFRWWFEPAAAHGLFAGLVLGYLIYDMIHWYTHVGAPKNRFLKYLRKQHMLHHFKEQDTRYGVSCPWWDKVFGTTGSKES